jgi:hypothetical protein
MKVEEIRIMTHFGVDKRCDLFVRTDAGRNITSSIRWGADKLDAEGCAKMMAMVTSAILQGATAIDEAARRNKVLNG